MVPRVWQEALWFGDPNSGHIGIFFLLPTALGEPVLIPVPWSKPQRN